MKKGSKKEKIKEMISRTWIMKIEKRDSEYSRNAIESERGAPSEIGRGYP